MSLAEKDQPKESLKANVLAVALEVPIEGLLGALISQCEVQRIPCDLERLTEEFSPIPHLIICGIPPEGISLNEVAQALRMQNPSCPIYCVCLARGGYDRKTLVKNGFNDAFLLPLDIEILKRAIQEQVIKLNSSIKSYRSVKLVDIHPGAILGFDTTIYLPTNNKYIRYSGAGEPLDESRVKRLSQHKMNSLYVSSEQMPKFYEYTAKRLKDLGSSQTLSETEKREKLETSIRDLMSGIFNDSTKDASFEQGKSLVADCQEIVKSYILGSSSGNWYKRLLVALGEMGSSYSHSANVSTYASLFSIGLQIGDPSALGMAGLLHDLGLADIPQEIVLKPENQRTKEEQATYKKHAFFSVEIIKSRKLILPPIVSTAILQHHECFNGTGYPNGLIGKRISKEAQVLALADRFDELIAVTEGKPLMTPAETILHFKDELAKDPGKMIFDPELLRQILKLFPENT